MLREEGLIVILTLCCAVCCLASCHPGFLESSWPVVAANLLLWGLQMPAKHIEALCMYAAAIKHRRRVLGTLDT
jgi:hypothetical protein